LQIFEAENHDPTPGMALANRVWTILPIEIGPMNLKNNDKTSLGSMLGDLKNKESQLAKILRDKDKRRKFQLFFKDGEKSQEKGTSVQKARTNSRQIL